LNEAAAACGTGSFQIMAGALDGVSVKPELLSYEGPFGVGYAVAAFEPLDPDEARRFGEAYLRAEADRVAHRRASESPAVHLARISLETFVRTGRRARLPDGLPDWMLREAAGTFLSLKKHGSSGAASAQSGRSRPLTPRKCCATRFPPAGKTRA
jgi:hypothetical protein